MSLFLALNMLQFTVRNRFQIKIHSSKVQRKNFKPTSEDIIPLTLWLTFN